MKKLMFSILLLVFIIACSSNEAPTVNKVSTNKPPVKKVRKAPTTIINGVNYGIDSTTYKASGYNERIQYVILHYTALDDDTSIRILTEQQVSSHYLITTRSTDPIYNLVPEESRAWHAGLSEFGRRKGLNDTSIGIEIVNDGFVIENPGVTDEFDEIRTYIPFKESQVLKVAKLVKNLQDKYDIDPTHILAHGDIAPTRKVDPGPLFPWKRFYEEYGIGAWYDHEDYTRFNNATTYNAYNVSDIKELFKIYGYPVRNINSTSWSEEDRKLIRAFQMHFRPSNVDGIMDQETLAVLMALNFKYHPDFFK